MPAVGTTTDRNGKKPVVLDTHSMRTRPTHLTSHHSPPYGRPSEEEVDLLVANSAHRPDLLRGQAIRFPMPVRPPVESGAAWIELRLLDTEAVVADAIGNWARS